MTDIVLKKGLKDVYFDTTETSYIDGSVGKLLYRGYNIHDLAEQSTFEETIFKLSILVSLIASLKSQLLFSTS